MDTMGESSKQHCRKANRRYPTVIRISQNSVEAKEGLILRDLRPLLVWNNDRQVWGPDSSVLAGTVLDVDGPTFLQLLREARRDTAAIDSLTQWITEQPSVAHAALYHYAHLQSSTLKAVEMVVDEWDRAVRLLLDLGESSVSRDEVKRKWDRYTTSVAGILVEIFFRFHNNDDILERLRRAINISLLMYLLDNPDWGKMPKRRIKSTLQAVYHRAVMQEAQSLAEAIVPLDELDEERRKRLTDFDPHHELVAYAARVGKEHGLKRVTSDLGIPKKDIYNQRRSVKRKRLN